MSIIINSNNVNDFQKIINFWFDGNSGLILKDVVLEQDVQLHFRKYEVPTVDNIFATIRFENCDFKGDIFFDNFVFKYDTHFINVKFHRYCTFAYAHFKRSVFFENCSFSNHHIGNSHFESTIIDGKYARFDRIIGAPRFWNIIFSENTNFVLNKVEYSKDYGVARLGEEAYRIAKNQAYRIGDDALGNDYYYQERSYKGFQIMPPLDFWDKNRKGFSKFNLIRSIQSDKHYRFVGKKFVDSISKYVIGYGEKPHLCVMWMLGVIVTLALWELA